MARKAYIVDYSMKNDYRIDSDTAIVFAESESEVKSVMENYVHLLNKNYGIWISNTDVIRLNNNYELDAIHSVKEFTGSVFTRLFTDDDEVRSNN